MFKDKKISDFISDVRDGDVVRKFVNENLLKSEPLTQSNYVGDPSWGIPEEAKNILVLEFIDGYLYFCPDENYQIEVYRFTEDFGDDYEVHRL